MNIGDLTYDVVTESIWIIVDRWFSSLTDEYLYDIKKIDEPNVEVVVNENTITYMRADFLKRSNSVLDKSEE